MNAPYLSKYYEYNESYERFGNHIIPTGSELYLYITDKIVPGVEFNRYSISNRVNIYDYKNNEFVKISYNTNYPSISLYNTDKNKYITSHVHRLYMLAFCYFPGCEKYEVNHIDGNKCNFHPCNLEWMTHRENMNHAFDYIMVNSRKKLSDQDIIELIKMYNNGEKIKDISNKFNISTGYVMDIVKDKRNSFRMENIKKNNPVTRTKIPPKISDDNISIIADRYNSGEEYYELADEYNVDRSTLTKAIKLYAKNNPDKIKLRPLKKFTPEMVESICKILESNGHLDKSSLYTLCLEELGLENNESNRKCVKNIYNGVTYKNISSKYNFNKSSTTIEKIAE